MELQERYFKALGSLNKGFEEPVVSKLMTSQMKQQDIYDLSKAMRHLEKYLADDDLLSANSEHLEENFWSRVEVKHKDSEKKDLFYIDDDL